MVYKKRKRKRTLCIRIVCDRIYGLIHANLSFVANLMGYKHVLKRLTELGPICLRVGRYQCSFLGIECVQDGPKRKTNER